MLPFCIAEQYTRAAITIIVCDKFISTWTYLQSLLYLYFYDRSVLNYDVPVNIVFTGLLILVRQPKLFFWPNPASAVKVFFMDYNSSGVL